MRYIVRNIIKTPRKSVSVILGITLIVFICSFGINIKLHNNVLLDEIKERTIVTVYATQRSLESERGKYIFNKHPILISDVRATGGFPEVEAYNFIYQSPDTFHSFEINLDADSLLLGRDTYEFEGSKYLGSVNIIGVRDVSFILDGTASTFGLESDNAEAIISEKTANNLGLNVGDTIHLRNGYPPLKIVSLCKAENVIYVPIKLLETIGKVDQDYEDLSVSCFQVEFRLKNPDAAQNFIRKVQQSGLFSNQWFYLEANDADYKVETARMKMLSIIIDVLVAGVLIAGGIILAGIVAFHIKNKQYDMKVLRLLGIKAGMILSLNLGEMIIFSAFGILSGIIFAAIICTALGCGFTLSGSILLLSVGIVVLCFVMVYIISAVMLHKEMRN